ncbi:uncharacterized protein LOC122301691 [Carya illinoinensis]|uniref:uncharacterized protein LOC122301691 n=1 Tax=Carya illinoinensis TaxID=32201 RepID=UPI001C727C11|nr:uncharacterized protein LOC122301691 [Carya illinoinensis]
MEKLQEMWETFQLNDEEGEAIELEEEGSSEVQRKGERSLIGKIWSERVIGKNIVENTMGRVWRLSKPAIFTEVGRNVFVITFATHADKNRVESGRPWLFDGNIFVMNVFDGYTPLGHMSFDKAAMWVQFHNLPLAGMSKECGIRLGSSLGEVEEVEVDVDDVGWGSFLRVRICLDLTKPLARGRTFKLQGVQTWVPITYEKLPRFCLDCGRIIHGEMKCNSAAGIKSDTKQFGSWLRADGGVRRFPYSPRRGDTMAGKSRSSEEGQPEGSKEGDNSAVNVNRNGADFQEPFDQNGEYSGPFDCGVKNSNEVAGGLMAEADFVGRTPDQMPRHDYGISVTQVSEAEGNGNLNVIRVESSVVGQVTVEASQAHVSIGNQAQLPAGTIHPPRRSTRSTWKKRARATGMSTLSQNVNTCRKRQADNGDQAVYTNFVHDNKKKLKLAEMDVRGKGKIGESMVKQVGENKLTLAEAVIQPCRPQ